MIERLASALVITVIVAVIVGMVALDNKRVEERKTNPEYQAQQLELKAQYYRDNTSYIRDMTTGICFARMTAPPHGMGIATVDCTLLIGIPVTDFYSKTKGAL